MFRTVLNAVTYADLNSLSDEALIGHLQQRQGDALAVLFRRYQRLVFSVAMKVLRDLGEAEDMTQSVFLQVYRSAAIFDSSRSSAKGWILKYSYHLSLNRRRHLALRQFYTADQIEEIDELAPLLVPSDMTYPEKKCLVEEGLAMLNQKQRRVLEMAHFEGLTLKEVAERTGESLGNVRHYYYRGLATLRERLSMAGEKELSYAQGETSRAEA